MYFSCWNSWEINFLFFQAFLNYLGSRYNFSFNYKRISAFYVKLCSFSTNCEVWIKSPKIRLLVHPHWKVFFIMALRSTSLLYSYTQAYKDDVSTVVNTSIHDDVRSDERNTHTDGIPVEFIILFDFDISDWMLQF